MVTMTDEQLDSIIEKMKASDASHHWYKIETMDKVIRPFLHLLRKMDDEGVPWNTTCDTCVDIAVSVAMARSEAPEDPEYAIKFFNQFLFAMTEGFKSVLELQGIDAEPAPLRH